MQSSIQAIGITMMCFTPVTMIAQCLYAYRIRAITDMTVIPAGIATVCDAGISLWYANDK
jgi:hypothetical protein